MIVSPGAKLQRLPDIEYPVGPVFHIFFVHPDQVLYEVVVPSPENILVLLLDSVEPKVSLEHVSAAREMLSAALEHLSGTEFKQGDFHGNTFEREVYLQIPETHDVFKVYEEIYDQSSQVGNVFINGFHKRDDESLTWKHIAVHNKPEDIDARSIKQVGNCTAEDIKSYTRDLQNGVKVEKNVYDDLSRLWEAQKSIRLRPKKTASK